MKKANPWVYQGTFALTFVSEEDADFVPRDHIVRDGSIVQVFCGKFRYSTVGYEFRTQNNIHFYIVPNLIKQVWTPWRTYEWYKQVPGSPRLCKRCGGSGQLLRPIKKKLLNFQTCSDCRGRGLKGKVKI